MNAYIISDLEYRTERYERLFRLVHDYLKQRSFEIEEACIGRDDLAFCMGCFGCWTKRPGECVIDDRMAELNRTFMNSDVVFYLCPVVFGQFSANIKNALDRWLPNILPFFETRSDGSSMHPPRYDDYPTQILVGYADDLSDEDARLFQDITDKHIHSRETLIYDGADAAFRSQLDGINMKRKGGPL